MTEVELVKKKLEKKEREIIRKSKKFMKSHGVEFNELHHVVIINAMREMSIFTSDMIRPYFEKIKQAIK